MAVNNAEVAIIGGGLAGLALASHLQKAGIDYALFEARNRWGGRIKAFSHDGAHYDLGPSWFWPVQPRLMALVKALNLNVFEQYAEGELLFEDRDRGVHRGMGYASMAGSLRVAGSMCALVDALVDRLAPERLYLNQPIQAIKPDGRLITADGSTIHAGSVVLALPPRVAGELNLGLAPEHSQLLSAIPTWMAGQAKFVAVYERPFWRDQGLSGDAMSQSGPLVEIHDASPADVRHGALFGFVGTPVSVRQNREQALKEAALVQLGRLFGPQALDPVCTVLQDWAFETETATLLDHSPSPHHPEYGLPGPLQNLREGRLLLGSSEAAVEFGGYLEGALERAEILAQRLINSNP